MQQTIKERIPHPVRAAASWCHCQSYSDAGQWLRGYQNAYNNPNANGDWSFSTGQNQHGDIGYWSSFSFDPGNRGDGHVNLDGVGVGTRFFAVVGAINHFRRSAVVGAIK